MGSRRVYEYYRARGDPAEAAGRSGYGVYNDQWYTVVEYTINDRWEAIYAVPPNGEFYTVTFNYPSDLNDPDSEILTTSVLTRKGYSATAPVSAEGWGWDSAAWQNVTSTCTVNLVQGTTVAVPAANTGLIYNGLEQTGVPQGEHYTLTGETATDAGTYQATATLDEGCFWPGGGSAPRKISYTIDKAPVTITGASFSKPYTGGTYTVSGQSWAGAEITLSQTEYYAHDVARTPEVTSVVLDGTTLTPSTDYTVSYTNNVNAGTALVTVTGKGNYTGTETAEFTILKPVNIGETEITLSQYEYTWTG